MSERARDWGVRVQVRWAMAIFGVALLSGAAVAQLPNVEPGVVSVEVQQVAAGLSSPVEMVSAQDGSGRLFIVEQPGRIRVLRAGVVQPTPFLDIVAQVKSGGERGLLGLAFHPGFSDPGSPGFRRFFTYQTEEPVAPADFTVPMSGAFDNQSVVTEWQVSAIDPDVVDLATRRDVVRIDQPQSNHNGGQIAFRVRDGYLYIAIGDGGAGNDVGPGHTPNLGNGQDTSNLLGKILRLAPLAPATTAGSADPSSGNGRYRVPANNPFVGVAGLDEIYAYGFRNPYRFSFDAMSDQLLVGDVGQGAIEEVNIVQSGGNYGWNRKEGSFLFNPANGSISPDPNPNPAFIDPVLEYDHGDGISVIGGFIYRGSAIPALAEKYVFGDFLRPPAGGRLFYANLATRVIEELRLGSDPRTFTLRIKGFGVDDAGEIYVMADNANNTAGQILQLVPIPAVPALLNFSTRGRVQAQENGFLIGGFIVTGSMPKSIVVRAIGPSLAVNGQPIPGRLTNPTLRLQGENGVELGLNDDWMTHPRQQEISEAGFAPSHPQESALLAELQPGAYTVTARGVDGETGIGLVEVFDAQRDTPANAVNFSTRGRVQPGDDALIGGVIFEGTQRVILRAIGPSLTARGVADALPNPTLQLVNASGVQVAFNDNWRSDQAADIMASGVPPENDAEAAIVATLPAGAYTAIVRGAGEPNGIALVEVFRLNP
ncbi:hypothetical protein BH20VER2_BH20VER2_13620 [soil metagenome]